MNSDRIRTSPNNHTWIPIHREAAHRLLAYKERQSELLALLTQMQDQGFTVIGLNDQEPKGTIIPLSVIDPFTFLASFNRGTTEEKRRENWTFLKKAWDLEAPVPQDFLGIPIANNQKSWWFPYAYRRDPAHVPALWALIEQAVDNAPGEIEAGLFDRCLGFKGTAIKNLTMGLFWINPEQWLAVDSVNQAYMNHLGIDIKITDFASYLKVIAVSRRKSRLRSQVHHRRPPNPGHERRSGPAMA